jgi:hypothetical protein
MEIKKKKKTRIKERTSITNWRFIDHMHHPVIFNHWATLHKPLEKHDHNPSANMFNTRSITFL